jgi:hypothetical protein
VAAGPHKVILLMPLYVWLFVTPVERKCIPTDTFIVLFFASSCAYVCPSRTGCTTPNIKLTWDPIVSYRGSHSGNSYSWRHAVAGSRPMRWMSFFNLPNPSSHTMALRFTQPLTEMSIRSRKIMFLGRRTRSVRRADNLTAICEPIV